MTAPFHSQDPGPPVLIARTWCAVACSITAMSFAAIALSGATDPVPMPITPPLMTAVVAAALTIAILAGSDRGNGIRASIAAATAVMLLGSLLAIPHTLLMVIVRTGQLLTDGSGPFDVKVSWPMTLAHGLNVLASSLVVLWLTLERRKRSNRCLRCGRDSAEPPTTRSRQHLKTLALVSVVAALPYGALKLAWSLGSDIGLSGRGITGVTASSPGFGDTVALTVLAILASLAMGTGTRAAVLRWPLIIVGTTGALMLIPVSIAAVAQLVPALWREISIDNSEIAPWALGIVYGSFLIWGSALAWLTIGYQRTTRPVCRVHAIDPVQTDNHADSSLKKESRMTEPTEFEVFEAGTYLHGTKAELHPGDLLVPGYTSNFQAGRTMRHVYITETLAAAAWGAQLAQGDQPERIYIVEPTGEIEDDPNVTDKKFPGNPTRSYRTRHPVRIVKELRGWTGHSPEKVKKMRDSLAELHRTGKAEIID